jgi:hypothetical protein
MKVACFAVVVGIFAVASCGGDADSIMGGQGTAGSAGLDAGPEAAAGSAGTAGAAGNSTGPGAEQACADFAKSYCDRLDACAPVYLRLFYESPEACAARLAPSCVKAVGLSDTTKTDAWTEACGKALDAVTCEDLLVRKTPAACVPAPGPRAEGATCGEDGQCATSYCQYQYNEGCGTCRTRAGAGESCNLDDDCAFGSACAPNKLCAVLGEADAACDTNHPCSPQLSCMGATATAQGACKPAGSAGAPCDPQQLTHPGCDLIHGYFCNVVSKICQEMKQVGGGDPCGIVGADYAICTASAMCKLTSTYAGNCLAAAKDGEACNVADGPQCTPLSQCLNGVCTPPEPSLCQ